MPKLPVLRPRDVEKILLRHGFYAQRQTGSHRVYYNPKSLAVAVVPFHSRDLPPGTLRSIIKQSKLDTLVFLP